MPTLANSVDPHQQNPVVYSGIRGDHCAGILRPVFPLLALLNQRWTFLVIPIGYLALQAVVAFVVDDLACGFYCGNLALVGAGLAGLAALTSAAQPVKDTKTRNEAEPRS